jgi:hypothetical protein
MKLKNISAALHISNNLERKNLITTHTIKINDLSKKL